MKILRRFKFKVGLADDVGQLPGLNRVAIGIDFDRAVLVVLFPLEMNIKCHFVAAL